MKVPYIATALDYFESRFVNFLAWTGFGMQFGFALIIEDCMLSQNMFFATYPDLSLNERLYPLLFLVSVTGSLCTFYLLTVKKYLTREVMVD